MIILVSSVVSNVTFVWVRGLVFCVCINLCVICILLHQEEEWKWAESRSLQDVLI